MRGIFLSFHLGSRELSPANPAVLGLYLISVLTLQRATPEQRMKKADESQDGQRDEQRQDELATDQE